MPARCSGFSTPWRTTTTCRTSTPTSTSPTRSSRRSRRSRGPLITPTTRVGAVVLAAGRGSRFGDAAPKTLARLGRRPLVAHAVAAARSSGLRPVVVVVGCQASDVAAAAGVGIEVLIENPNWEEGMSTSLRAGLAAILADRTVTAVAVALADQPRIGAEAYRRLADAHRDGAELAVATYD